MKLRNPRLAVPYIGMDEDGQSTRCWANFAFKGDVDYRRIKREVRKWAKRAIDRSIHTGELRAVVTRKRITTDE